MAVPGGPQPLPAAACSSRTVLRCSALLAVGALLLRALAQLGLLRGLEVSLSDNVQNSALFLDHSQYLQTKLRRKHLLEIVRIVVLYSCHFSAIVLYSTSLV